MKNPICVSTGCVYKLTNDHNRRIEMLKKFEIQGIMLCFADADAFLEFEISRDNLNYLQNFKFNSIHLPWLGINYASNDKCLKVLEKTELLCQTIKIKCATFHQLTDKEEDFGYDILNRFGFTAAVENDDWKYPARLVSPIRVKKILEKHKKLKFVFDFAHALTLDTNLIPDYFRKFKGEIVGIHVAMLKKSMRDHWFLHKYKDEKLKEYLKFMDDESLPLVIESVVENAKEVGLIKDEVNFLRTV